MSMNVARHGGLRIGDLPWTVVSAGLGPRRRRKG